MTKTQRFVLCIENKGYPASLDVRKVYRVLADADADAEKQGRLRIVDESGEDYLYPGKYFVPIALPRGASKAFTRHSA